MAPTNFLYIHITSIICVAYLNWQRRQRLSGISSAVRSACLVWLGPYRDQPAESENEWQYFIHIPSRCLYLLQYMCLTTARCVFGICDVCSPHLCKCGWIRLNEFGMLLCTLYAVWDLIPHLIRRVTHVESLYFGMLSKRGVSESVDVASCWMKLWCDSHHAPNSPIPKKSNALCEHVCVETRVVYMFRGFLSCRLKTYSKRACRSVKAAKIEFCNFM